ncbi:TPA: gp58-like family protein, partial [Streptococcus suis]
AELVRRIETADGKAVDAKSYAQQTAEGFKSRIESLETYKDAEGTRASQYLTASRTETAKQIAAERTAIATDYVAKSTYTEDVRGTTQRLNEIKSTADTAKQNLATYQNTVDRKLEELTSSTQTLDGKINTASSKVDTVAGQIRTELSEVASKIPVGFGNMLLNSGSGWRNLHSKTFVLAENIRAGEFYTISAWWYRSDNSTLNIGIRANANDSWQWVNLAYSSSLDCWTATFKSTKNVPAGYSIYFFTVEKNGIGSANWTTLVPGTKAMDKWQPALAELRSDIETTKTTINQTSQGVEQLSTSLATTDNKVSTAETKINQLIGDVSSKVSQTDYNTLTDRMDNAETAITQNATEISKRLTSTQVEQAITDKGYATVTVLENKVRETADSFSRTISETKALIPNELSGNLLLASNVGWSNAHDKNYVLADKLEKGKTYTLVSHYRHGDGATAHTSTIGDGAWNRLTYNPAIDSWMVTFQAKADIPAGHQVYLASSPETALGSSTFVTLVKGTIPLSRWEPSYAELATVTALHNVEDTVSSHTRTIGAIGETGSILDNVSKVTQTANGLVTEVSGENGLKTQVSTLAGSYAIKSLTKAGDVLGQINLNKDGSVKIDGSLVQITGKTYIENGVIKEAMIGKGQIGTAHIGEIDAGIAKIINLDVSNVKGLDAEFIKAKIENAFIGWMKGKTITAQNEAMTIGLNDAFIRFKDNAKIEFQSENNTLYRTKNGTSAFIHFRDDSYNGVYTAMGVNADNTGTQNDYSSGAFAGVRVIRSNPSRYSGTTVDQVQLVGDEIRIRHGYGYENDYLVIKWDNQGKIDLIKFLRSVASRLGLPLT